MLGEPLLPPNASAVRRLSRSRIERRVRSGVTGPSSRGASSSGETGVVVEMTGGVPPLPTALAQPLECVLTDCREHPQPPVLRAAHERRPSTSAGSSPRPRRTASPASRSKPPAKTPSAAKRSRAAGVRRSSLHEIADRSVRCRSGRSRAPPAASSSPAESTSSGRVRARAPARRRARAPEAAGRSARTARDTGCGREAASRRTCALDEECRGVLGREWRHRHVLLAVEIQPLTARREHRAPAPRRAARETTGAASRTCSKLSSSRRSSLSATYWPAPRRPSSCRSAAERRAMARRARDLQAARARRTTRRRRSVCELVGRLQRDPVLPIPPAGERDEPRRAAQQRGDLVDLLAAADQRRRGSRQPAALLQSCGLDAECGILPQDRALELTQLGPGLEPELVEGGPRRPEAPAPQPGGRCGRARASAAHASARGAARRAPAARARTRARRGGRARCSASIRSSIVVRRSSSRRATALCTKSS